MDCIPDCFDPLEDRVLVNNVYSFMIGWNIVGLITEFALNPVIAQGKM